MTTAQEQTATKKDDDILIELQSQEPVKKAVFAEKFSEFFDALDALYIKGNLSGRLHFREQWPHAAEAIFSGELMQYDEDGTEDRERRAVLEEEADLERVKLLDLLSGVEENSVDKGSLQNEYIADIVGKLKRNIALYVYDKSIVDKFLPPTETEAAGDAENNPEAATPTPQAVSDLDDTIQPIDVSPPAEAQARPEEAPPEEAAPDQSRPEAVPEALAPIQTQDEQPQSFPAESSSGLNLSAKRNVIQVDFVTKGTLSYDRLVAAALEAEAEMEEPPRSQSATLPHPDIEIATDPPAPMTQVPPPKEPEKKAPSKASGEFAAPATPNAPPVRAIFNACAKKG